MTKLVTRNLQLSGSLLFFLIIAMITMMPGVAFADDAVPAGPAEAPTALHNFYNQVMDILIPVFVSFVGALGVWILTKIKAKFHLEVSDKTMTQWKDLAQSAAYRGAEWARAKGKTLVEGKKIPGGDVMDVAANWAMQMAEQQKLPAMAREKLIGLIESELFKIRQAEAIELANTPNVVADISKMPTT